MANIKFSEFTDVISTYSNIFIVGYDSVLNDNIRILSTDVPAIIGAITGSGTPGALPKFITDTSLGDSLISDDGIEVTIAGYINATAFVKVGGIASEFLKADGSVDSNAYITLADLSASAPLSYDNSTGAFSIAQADSTTDGYLSALDWNTFNQKQAALGGTGIVKSTSGTISYITDNSANWNTSYNNMIVSAAVTGTTTKTLTLNQQDGGTITASWTDENTDAVTSVFGRTGAVVAQSGDYTTTLVTEGTNLYFTNARARAAFSSTVTGLTYNSTTGVLSTTAGYGIPTTASQSNWDTAYNDRISTANTPLSIAANVISISQSSSTTNGYLSSTDWTTFNSKQAAGNYITSLTGEATGSGPGAASVTLSNSAVIAKVLSGLNITGGSVTSTDSILTAFGKVQNQINGLAGGVTYQGTWDASTNTPTLTSSEGTQGYYYVVNVAGSTDLNGITDWNLGDWAIFDGSVWQQVDNTDSVISVNGFVGIVSLTTTDIPEGTNLYYTNARSRAAFSETVTGLDYNSTTGVLSTTSGYGIPTTASQSNWDTAYNERISSLTTTGSSGAATLAANTLNIPNYTLAGLGGVPTSRTLTINGVSYDLSANRTWSIDSMIYPSAGIAISTGTAWGTSITDNSSNWNTAYSERISSATAPLSISSNVISISQSGTSTNGYLSSTDWNTFNSKQPTLSGTGLVKSTAGTISYITDNSGNWNTAYNDSIVSAAVTGTSTKTLTLTQQDGGTVTASWSDADTGLTSVGVSMPSAFTVSNSPLTSNGTIAITGAGTTAQYVRGDGTLATFPTISNEAQRLITEVYNETGATLTKGTVVYINGGHGNLPTITKALATSDATSAQTYGVVQNDITDQNNGFVVVIGSLIDLNTNAYPNGTILYLSSTVAGEWTSVKQYAPAHLVYVGIVTRSHPTQGVVEVRVQNGYEMDELHNVSAQNPNNGDILQFVTSTQLWTKTAGTTTNIAEGTNLYYTDARSRAAFSTTVVGLQYNSTTGVLGIQSGYSIPTNASQTNWNTAYTERISSATAPLSIVGNNISMSAASGSTNGYLTSTDWNTFNDKQAAGSYITALTGEATASGPGSAAVTLTNNAVTAKVLTGLNITGGTVNATDSIVTAFGKVQNQLNGLVGGTIYKGVWNASTNSPSLSSGVGTQGWYYIVNVAGSTNLDGITDWNIGDWAIFDGTAWQQVDNTDSVTSVNGFTGAVSLTTSNISEGTNLYYTQTRFDSAFAAKTTTDLAEGTNLYFTNARAQGAISLTTLGTSGAATYSGGVLNIPQYQAALTDPVTGVGTTNYVAKWTSGSAIGNSSIYDNGTFVGIGSTTALGGKLNITFDSTSADAIILKDTRASLGSGQWRIGPGSGVIGFGIYSDLLGYSPLAITNSGAATFSSTVNASSFTANNRTILSSGGVFDNATNGNDIGFGFGAGVIVSTNGAGTYTAQSLGNTTYPWASATFSGIIRANALQTKTADGSYAWLLNDTAGTNKWEIGHYNNDLYFYSYGSSSIPFIINDSTGISTFNSGTVNQNTTISGSKVGMSRTSDGAEVVYLSKNTDLGVDGTANIQGYDGIQFRTQGAETVKMTIAASGTTTITNLAGSGSRMVVADASGVLSTQAIPSGSITGSGTAGYITKWTGGNAVGNSVIIEIGSGVSAAIGIGITPSYTLDVNGTGRFIGQLTINGNSEASTVLTLQESASTAIPLAIRNRNSNQTWGFAVDTASVDDKNFGIYNITGSSFPFTINATTNAATFTSLAGTGSRMVVTDASGTLSTQAIPSGAVVSVFGRTGAVVAVSGDYTTAQVTESGNLYYTDTRARAALSFAAGSGAYNTTTGVITIPTNNNQIANGAGYITSSALGAYLPLSGGTLTGNLNATSATFSGVITLPQNPVGTTYGNGISASPTYMIYQGAGDNDAIRFYAESAATNQVTMVFEVNDDIETSGSEWIFRNKKTYGDYAATTPFRISGAGVAYANGYTVLTAENYNSYAPTLTGTGASGTWGISISGNAATATSATTAVTLTSTQSNWNSTGVVSNVVGLLAWKNYGNGHVIFDASQGISPSGGAVNQTNSTNAWTTSFPTLMGWNGVSTYGVRVDSARLADAANYATTANALTSMNISQFTNDSGYVTSSVLSGYALVNHTHDLGRYSLQAPAYIDGLTTSNFRSTLFGLTSNTFNISTARWNTTPTALPGMNSYGTMMAWSGADTQGFIATDYYSSNITVGGGNGSSINWSVLLIHSGNIASYLAGYLPLTGGTITGSLSIINDLTVNNKVYVGTNGCYFQEVLIGGVYELQVVDSAGNITVLS